MIRLNYIPFKKQEFDITIFRRKLATDEAKNEQAYYSRFQEASGSFSEYEIKYEADIGFEEYKLFQYSNPYLIARDIYNRIVKSLPKEAFIKKDNKQNLKIHFTLEEHPKGKKCVWIKPYFLKSKSVWGIILDYNFSVADRDAAEGKFKLDKDILIASGTLTDRGNSNFDYYLFKHNYIHQFITKFVPVLNNLLDKELESDLIQVESQQLAPKTYLFGNGVTNNSAYLGLSKNHPLHSVQEQVAFYFIYKKSDRDIAVSLLKGLRGESNPTTFSGMEKLFRLPFSNNRITGVAVDELNSIIIDKEISNIKAMGGNVLPIIITNAKKDEEDEVLYYTIKHKFTNAGIPCQVVTKELIRNDYSLKYSLSNIGLQIFSKCGGKPWKMKSASNEYLIVGIGQSYNLEEAEDGVKVEKNITYSVLTDSSGLFKDIQVLSEGIRDEQNYYDQLVSNLSNIIVKAGHKKVSIHTPVRLSRDKILDRVVANIGADVELSVLVINSKNDYFGYDYNNNGLVPFESTYIKISSSEYLVWFEGLQYNNPKINKRFGNPLLIKFWFSTKQGFEGDFSYKQSLLQDCINLSGANWRGFKAKQLPVSIFYCERIADFIGKFKQYELAHIEVSNLKPWFL